MNENPVCRERLKQEGGELPETFKAPQDHFIFQGEGNIPQVPVLEKDRHFFGSGASFYALNAEDGAEIWRRQMFGYPSSPVTSRGMLYLSSWGRVYAFSLADLRMRWCFPLGASFTAAPVIGNNRIYVGILQGKMICLKFKSYL